MCAVCSLREQIPLAEREGYNCAPGENFCAMARCGARGANENDNRPNRESEPRLSTFVDQRLATSQKGPF
jgi:hypothetical protein